MSDNATYQFVDTNVLVYAHDRSAGRKYTRAQHLLQELWESEAGCLSTQVLQAFYVTVTRKVAKPLPAEQASRIIDDLGAWRIHRPTVQDIRQAIAIQTRYIVSFWDAMIIRSAACLGCVTLWSEDLNARQLYERVRVANPFDVS